VQAIAENFELLKTVLRDPENAHKLLGVLNVHNKDYLTLLLRNLSNLGTEKKGNRIEDLVLTLKLIVPESKPVIDVLLKDSKKYKITNMSNFRSYLQEIKPENATFAFNELMPLIVKNNDKLKLESASSISTVLGHLTPETKDAIKIVADNAEKLQLDDLSVAYLLAAITPQNKKAITILADNAKKFELNGFFADDFKKLLDSGESGISK